MGPVRCESLDDGRLALVTIDAGKGNVLSTAVIKELMSVLVDAQEQRQLRGVVLAAAGPHFSFGASVAEHLPDQARGMLRWLHDLLRTVLRSRVPVIVAAQGRCLGGGLELALACARIIVSSDATLGAPEVRLGVFAPAASALLPLRIGPAAAEQLLVTGQTLTAVEAVAIGLADEITPPGVTPVERAIAWAREGLAPLSAPAVRTAFRAASAWRVDQAADRIARLEELYLEEVLPNRDAAEGLTAFLEKRAPRWQCE